VGTAQRPRKRPAPGDEERLDALLERLDLEALPAALCWCWPPLPLRAALARHVTGS